MAAATDWALASRMCCIQGFLPFAYKGLMPSACRGWCLLHTRAGAICIPRLMPSALHSTGRQVSTMTTMDAHGETAAQ